jgi:hypothetical protein
VVELEDIRQILPFVLHDKLTPDTESPFFEATGNAPLKVDRISWIRRMFDMSLAEFDRLDLDKNDPVAALEEEFEKGLEGVTENESRARLVKIENLLSQWSKGRKLYGNLYDDIIKLKYLHQRYTNYLAWVKWKN